jgi:alkylation response protein AidB-like acyl-CoA dehydrogenase
MTTDTTDALRQEAREWFEKNWRSGLTYAEWWALLFEGRWSALTWPADWYGRGLTRAQARIVQEERLRVGAPGGPAGLSVMLAGPTILVHGTDEQKHRYLPAILRGEEAWCQLFSEPGAGSDLAGLQAKAVRDGDRWIVTGQKVWSSGAHLSDLGMLLARTDPDVPKHQGITYFIIEMDQPGIEVRPIREMTGRALFNEVFLDEAVVEGDAVLGPLNGGWTVANTTLAAERASLGGGGEEAGGIPGGRRAGMLERPAEVPKSRSRQRSGTAVLLGGRVAGELIALAREKGLNSEPHVRQGLARLWSLEHISRTTALRARSAGKAARGTGLEGSIQKLGMSRQVRLARDIGMGILGADGMLTGPEAPTGGVIQELALFSPAPSIYGGSDEIQKNIVGERVLGLPKEPSADSGVPFREIRKGG